MLEYFEGIMFLTTNRVETIDTAFKSRIHLSVFYPPLSEDAKKELWNSLIARGNSDRRPRWLNARLLAQIAKANVNGREIKNIVRMAHALSKNARREMKASDILQGIAAMETFNADFTQMKARKDAETLYRSSECPKTLE